MIFKKNKDVDVVVLKYYEVETGLFFEGGRSQTVLITILNDKQFSLKGQTINKDKISALIWALSDVLAEMEKMSLNEK